jgi:transposase
MSQLDHILSKLREQEKALKNLNSSAEQVSRKYLLTRLNTIMERIGYYKKLLIQFGKRGLIIQIKSETYINLGAINILKPYFIYYTNINKVDALKLFNYEHPGEIVISIMEITPGKMYSKKSKKFVAKE